MKARAAKYRKRIPGAVADSRDHRPDAPDGQVEPPRRREVRLQTGSFVAVPLLTLAVLLAMLFVWTTTTLGTQEPATLGYYALGIAALLLAAYAFHTARLGLLIPSVMAMIVLTMLPSSLALIWAGLGWLLASAGIWTRWRRRTHRE